MGGRTWARSDQLTALARPGRFDLLVIGGGIVGVGAALDAAARGMRVAVVERTDFGAGTTGRSTKLLHGGIRYMPQFRFGLVREGLREQKVLRRTADYLYQRLEFVLPLYRDRGFGDVPALLRHRRIISPAMRLGLWLYDLLGGRWKDRHRRLDATAVHRMAPRLATENLRGGFLYVDAQTDDARLALAVARTAVERFGAVAVNWAEVATVHHDGDGYLVTVHDRLGDTRLEVRTRAVVAATGAFNPPAPDGAARIMGITRSKGIHIVADPAEVGLADRAVVLPETEDHRVLYMVPWQGKAIIGTTDTPHDGPADHPRATQADIEYLVRHVAAYLPGVAVRPISAWGGLRALATREGAPTAAVSREDKIRETSPGYVQVAGGKLTGYRVTARKVVDVVAERLRVRVRSGTARLALTGTGASESEVVEASVAAGFGEDYGRLLYRRYGSHAADVLAIAAADPSLARALGDGYATAAEAVYAARHECAATLADFVQRRTRLAWFTPDHGRQAAESVTRPLAGELGWSDEEAGRHLDLLEAELAAEGL